MLLNTHRNVNIQLVMNSFGTLFHDQDFSVTCFKFPNISGFSRQVVSHRELEAVIIPRYAGQVCNEHSQVVVFELVDNRLIGEERQYCATSLIPATCQHKQPPSSHILFTVVRTAPKFSCFWAVNVFGQGPRILNPSL